MTGVNLARLLTLNARRFADREALVFEGRRWTYADLDRDVNALAAGLRADGVTQDVRVAIVSDNVPEVLILMLALARLGAVSVPLNYRLTARELAQLLDHAEVYAVATVPEYASVTDEALTNLPAVRRWALESVDETWTGIAVLSEPHRGEVVPDADLPDDALQRIVYTSGTTSLPKGVLISHGNVHMNIYAQVVELGLRWTDRVLNAAPLYHVGGTDLPGFAIWQVGGCMVLHRRFDASRVLEAMEVERITGMVVAATMLDMLRRAAEERPYDLTEVRWLIFSQVSPALFFVARNLFPNARLIEGYGLTETCSALTYLDEVHMDVKQGSVGLPVPLVEVRVVDEAGRTLPSGESGEVVARGPKVSGGYLDDPGATADAFRNGWFHTGDIGYLDQDGYLYIRDRLKDMIRSGGENMSSAEIENVLTAHPLVLAASVVGAPHPRWQEVPVAFVVARPGLETADLVAHARRQLGKFKVPKEIYVVDDLPTNQSGKVLKRTLREMRPTMMPSWTYEA